jgi:AAA ATPase domain/Protein of unknown function (DUF3696)
LAEQLTLNQRVDGSSPSGGNDPRRLLSIGDIAETGAFRLGGLGAAKPSSFEAEFGDGWRAFLVIAGIAICSAPLKVAMKAADMITEGTLTNFKSWRAINKMRFAPITGFFGTNSSGKTSILQWLLLLKQTVESSDRLQVLNFGDHLRDPVELGSFEELVHTHDSSTPLSWKLSWTLPKELKVADPAKRPGSRLLHGSQLSYFAEILQDPHRLRVARMGYEFADLRFLYEAKKDSSSFVLSADGDNAIQFKRFPGRAWQLPAPVKCYGFPDQVTSYYQNAGFLADFQLAFEEQMARTYYLGPLREYPQRQYNWPGSQPADMGRRGEKVIDALLAARQAGVTISRGKGRPKRTLEEYAAHWLKQLGLIHTFEVEPVAKGSNLYQVWVQKTPASAKVLITDVGFGISQILPVIVLCYYVPEGATIILEQPEIHLHPSVEAGLADVFIDAIKVRKIQILLESHSEYLLRRLQRRIAEEAEHLASDDIALYFCDYQKNESHLVQLDVDAVGNIRNWPDGFFGDELGELGAITKAQMERQRKQPA